MSFNANHKESITLLNYELFFLLYVDEELDAAEKTAVEAFLQEHPALQAELDALLGTRLPAEDLTLDKAALLSPNMKLQALDEDLFLYLDNELPAEGRRAVELQLALDAGYQREWLELQQARLDPADAMPYPGKKELYRREKRILAPWLRVAAAAVLLLTGGVVYYAGQQAMKPAGPAVAFEGSGTARPAAVNRSSHTSEAAPAATGTGTPREAVATAAFTPNTFAQKENGGATRPAHSQPSALVATTGGDAPAGVKGPANIRSADNPVSPASLAAASTMGAESTQPAPALNREPVALNTTAAIGPAIAPAYHASEINKGSAVTSLLAARTTDNTAPDDQPDAASAKNGSLKSLFRKATRMLAKSAGLDKLTNEDEVMIGAVTVSVR